jgi:hypothetical protein
MIPGLVAITDEQGPDGSVKIVFEVEDDKQAEFFAALGLTVGDTDGLQRAVIESIQMALGRQRADNS